MDVKCCVVNFVLKQNGTFANKTEIITERKIRQCVVDKQQAERGHRYPKQHPTKEPHRLLHGEHSSVPHKKLVWENEIPIDPPCIKSGVRTLLKEISDSKKIFLI